MLQAFGKDATAISSNGWASVRGWRKNLLQSWDHRWGFCRQVQTSQEACWGTAWPGKTKDPSQSWCSSMTWPQLQLALLMRGYPWLTWPVKFQAAYRTGTPISRLLAWINLLWYDETYQICCANQIHYTEAWQEFSMRTGQCKTLLLSSTKTKHIWHCLAQRLVVLETWHGGQTFRVFSSLTYPTWYVIEDGRTVDACSRRTRPALRIGITWACVSLTVKSSTTLFMRLAIWDISYLQKDSWDSSDQERQTALKPNNRVLRRTLYAVFLRFLLFRRQKQHAEDMR